LTRENAHFRSITIRDVDESVRNWFRDRVDIHVKTPTDELKKVPVLFASGERWATNRDKRGIRDKNGLLILPLISIRRTSMERTKDRMSLGVETERMQIARRVDKKTSTVQNAISDRDEASRLSKKNDRIVYEITTIPYPDHFLTTYEVIFWAQYIGQMNSMVEKVFDSFDIQSSFVMPIGDTRFGDDPKDDRDFDARQQLLGRSYFVGYVDTSVSDAGNFEEFTDQERIVRYSFNVEVPTFLDLEPDGERPAIQRKYTSYQVSIGDESITFVDDPEELDKIFS